MAMPSTLLFAGLLLLLPVPFVRTDQQPYKMDDDEDINEGYTSYFYKAPAVASSLASSLSSSSAVANRFRSFPGAESDPRRLLSQNFLSLVSLVTMVATLGHTTKILELHDDSVNDDDVSSVDDGRPSKLHANLNHRREDLRQSIGSASMTAASRESAMDNEQIEDQDEDEAAGRRNDGNQRASSVDNNDDDDYPSKVARMALMMQSNKRSALSKRLQFLNQDMRDRYVRMFAAKGAGTGSGRGGGIMLRELKRERHGVSTGVGGGGGGGPTLSVESPMDLIRQRLMQELRRREFVQKQRQIQTNDELLSSIGKRASPPAPPSSSSFNSRLFA